MDETNFRTLPIHALRELRTVQLALGNNLVNNGLVLHANIIDL